jgi:hypothetical protein
LTTPAKKRNPLKIRTAIAWAHVHKESGYIAFQKIKPEKYMLPTLNYYKKVRVRILPAIKKELQ